MGDYYDYEYFDPQLAERERDSKIDEAKAVVLREVFESKPEAVFYARQIEVLLEKSFFHWITSGALTELVDEGRVNSRKEPLVGATEIRFFWSRSNRYWRRRANRVRDLVLEFSKLELGLGSHGELMFDAGLARSGFVHTAVNVRSYGGKTWVRTGHDLDRVYVRDGVAYGAEIKNTLDYIPKDELDVKLEMCDFFGVRPLFIMRWAPKSYNHQIIERGGFALLFEEQLYPLGHGELARKVREELGIPAACPRSLAEGIIGRFEKWHEKQLEREKKEGKA